VTRSGPWPGKKKGSARAVPPADISSERLAILSYFWTPLVSVGCSRGSHLNAQISVSTFGASIVPDQPRLLCVLYKANFTHELVTEKGSFSVCILAENQIDLVPKLGFVSGRHEDKLAGLDVDLTPKGNPILRGGLGWLECETIEQFDLGDATCFLAAVGAFERIKTGEPLSWAKVRLILPPEWLEQWGRKIEADIQRSRQSMRWLNTR
jgi:flavin reductase (DIM6/NTAB) family NADH-FMN oxidoreductase RutF